MGCHVCFLNCQFKKKFFLNDTTQCWQENNETDALTYSWWQKLNWYNLSEDMAIHAINIKNIQTLIISTYSKLS